MNNTYLTQFVLKCFANIVALVLDIVCVLGGEGRAFLSLGLVSWGGGCLNFLPVVLLGWYCLGVLLSSSIFLLLLLCLCNNGIVVVLFFFV